MRAFVRKHKNRTEVIVSVALLFALVEAWLVVNRSLSLKWPRFEFSPTGLGSVSACLSMSSQRSNFMLTVVSTTGANTSLGR
jgi:hypothetical protein